MKVGCLSSSLWVLASALFLVLASAGSASAFLAPGPCAPRLPFAHGRPQLRGGGSACSTLRMATEKEMETARFAVADAAEACRSVAASLSTKMEEGTLGKKDLSPVTVGDFAVQAIVCKRLMEAFPNDEVRVSFVRPRTFLHADFHFLSPTHRPASRLLQPPPQGQRQCQRACGIHTRLTGAFV
jgi:hypothetical protein